MTKDEIKKALVCYEKIDLDCHKCPYNIYDECCIQVRGDALALITEQEKEIERLRTTLGQCNTELNSALESLKSQCREIGKLKAGTKQAQLNILGKLWSNISNSKQLIQSYIADGSFTIEDIYMEIDELIKEVQNAEDKG